MDCKAKRLEMDAKIEIEIDTAPAKKEMQLQAIKNKAAVESRAFQLVERLVWLSYEERQKIFGSNPDILLAVPNPNEELITYLKEVGLTDKKAADTATRIMHLRQPVSLLNTLHTLKNTIKDMKFGNKIFDFQTTFLSDIPQTSFNERACYVDLYRLIDPILSTSGICICGDPGIGKTSFSLYIFAKLVQEHKRVFRVMESGSWLYYDGTQLVFGDTSFPVWRDSDIVLLLDGVASGLFLDKASNVILFASPSRQNHHKFMKISNRRMFYMPPWSWPEIEEAFLNGNLASLVPGFNNDDKRDFLKKRFRLIGGRSRILLEESRSLDSLKEQIMVAVSGLTVATLRNIEMISIIDQIPNICYSIIPFSNFTRYRLTFASPVIRLVAANEVLCRLHENSKNLLDLTTYSGIGYGMAGEIYEFLAARLLLMGGKFPMKKLIPPTTYAYAKNVKVKQSTWVEKSPNYEFLSITAANDVLEKFAVENYIESAPSIDSKTNDCEAVDPDENSADLSEKKILSPSCTAILAT